MKNINKTDLPNKMKEVTDDCIKHYLKQTDVPDEEVVEDLGKNPDGRYASFDYCFNYFHSFSEDRKKMADNDHMRTSCLHIALFLASWGMFRHSFLLQRSIRYYKQLVKYISETDDSLWKIDVTNYNEENIQELMNCRRDIEKRLPRKGNNKPTQTLVTKIMMSVFGNVPAFDNNFVNGSGLKTFNGESLEMISIFYNEHKKIIDTEANDRHTFEFSGDNNQTTKIKYTKAKIIDMIFFAKGLKP